MMTPRSTKIYKSSNVDDILSGIIPSTPRSNFLVNRSNRAYQTKTQQSSTVNPPTTHLSSPNEFSITRFATRLNSGKIEETLNDSISYISNANQGHQYPRVQFTTTVDPRIFNYRYQFEKISEKSDALDRMINEAAEIFKEFYDMDEGLLNNPGVASQSEVIAIGRICCDHELSKLNDKGILLETSRRMGNGCRVPLKLDKLLSYSFFPGQIVGVQGVNSDGKGLVVSKVFELPLSPMAATQREKMLEFNHSQSKLDGKPLNMMISHGPYTLDDNLEYEPFEEFISILKREKPDVVILLGPFVDSKHPHIQSGECDELPEEIFQRNISKRLEDFLSSSTMNTTQVILIPHVRDMVNAHISFPQSPLDKSSEGGLGLPKQVKCLSNPIIFSINEIVFGITNNDVLFGLGQEEYARNPTRTDRMARLTRYLLEQASFYPLFPGLIEANVDVTHSGLFKIENKVMVDILIVPSQLRYFTKIVDNVVCVNPGSLTKSKSGGTYTRMCIIPMNRNVLETEQVDEEVMEHEIWKRARVDIVRI